MYLETKMVNTSIHVLVSLVLLSSCADNSFKSSGQRKAAEKDPVASSLPALPSTNPTLSGPTTSGPVVPPVVAQSVDYKTCATLPAGGKSGYRQCPLNSAVVIVNDGKKAELSCCPVADPSFFSTIPTEQNIVRNGMCGSSSGVFDEVLTGMIDTSPRLFCTKIDTTRFLLSSPVPAIYSVGTMAGDLGPIAASYNNGDTCVCPAGTLAIGGHTKSDNTCGEQCVQVVKK
jgi:hypothetical protein